MIKGFEEQTEPISELDKSIASVIARGLSTKIGRKNSINSGKMISAMNKVGIKLTDVKLRLIIHYIRQSKLLRCLCADNRGYYVAETKEELDDYIESLQQRVDSQQAILDSIIDDAKFVYESKQVA